MINTTLTFTTLIRAYKVLQSQLVAQIRALTSKGLSSANPSAFILLQFQMSQVTQVGESISNLISQVNSVINNSVRNQKTQ
jgi:recombinational DNA repair protein RecR